MLAFHHHAADAELLDEAARKAGRDDGDPGLHAAAVAEDDRRAAMRRVDAGDAAEAQHPRRHLCAHRPDEIGIVDADLVVGAALDDAAEAGDRQLLDRRGDIAQPVAEAETRELAHLRRRQLLGAEIGWVDGMQIAERNRAMPRRASTAASAEPASPPPTIATSTRSLIGRPFSLVTIEARRLSKAERGRAMADAA